jgi:predicted HAD superfamily phosphohydrolase YqeG
MDNLLVNVNYQVLEQVGWTDNSSIQALRKYFDDSKDAAKKLLLDEANKMLKDIDDCYEKLLTNVVLSALKPLELKMKEHK